MRQRQLLVLSLALVGCAVAAISPPSFAATSRLLPPSRTTMLPPSGTTMLRPSGSTVLRPSGTTLLRLVGQTVPDAPLLPQPGNIWADVLPAGQAAVRARPSSLPAKAGPVQPRPSSAQPPPRVAARAVADPTRQQPRQARLAPRRTAEVAQAPSSARGMVPPDHGLMVQLTATASPQQAAAAWHRLRRDAPELTAGHNPAVQQAEVDGRAVWRLRTGGFADLAQAHAFCSSLRAVKAACWVVPPSMLR